MHLDPNGMVKNRERSKARYEPVQNIQVPKCTPVEVEEEDTEKRPRQQSGIISVMNQKEGGKYVKDTLLLRLVSLYSDFKLVGEDGVRELISSSTYRDPYLKAAREFSVLLGKIK
jgi:hypothetical protein